MVKATFKNADGVVDSDGWFEDQAAVDAWVAVNSELLPPDFTVVVVDQTQDIAWIRAQRRLEYPPIGEFADAYVKLQEGNPAQMDAYIASCLAVKAKYPKPS